MNNINVATNLNFNKENMYEKLCFVSKKHNYKLYGLVLRHLSQLQKYIQFSHAVVEFSHDYHDDYVYNQWFDNNKTMVMLDVSSSIEMENIISKLKENNYKISVFREPDLNNICTCVCFIMDTSDCKDGYNNLIYDILLNKITVDESNELKKIIKNKKISQ